MSGVPHDGDSLLDVGHGNGMGRRSLAGETALELQVRFGHSPFTVDEARSAGFTPSRLRAAVGAGVLARPHRGVYYVPRSSNEGPQSDLLMSACALARGLPDSAVSHSSAALLRGLPVPARHRETGHVTLPGSRARIVGTVRIHSGQLPPHHITAIGAIRVTTPPRTALDIARSTALPEALICMDAVLRQHVDRQDEDGLPLRMAVHDPTLIDAARTFVADVLGDMPGWPGTRTARKALEWADPASESPLESESRGVLLIHGVPRPECGYPIEGADGRTYWADMAWPDARVIGECDGLVKYADPSVLYREKLRQEAIERAGWRVVRWTHADIVRSPAAVAQRVHRALSLNAA